MLTLHMLGYEPLPADPRLSSDGRAALPPEEYFPLMRIFCKKIASLDHEALLTFLSPSFYQFLTLLTKDSHVTPQKKLPVQVAITHWLFAEGDARFFAFLDTLNFLSHGMSPSMVFRHFHFNLFPNYSPTFRLLHGFHQRYRPLYEAQGVQALEERGLQRREAWVSSTK